MSKIWITKKELKKTIREMLSLEEKEECGCDDKTKCECSTTENAKKKVSKQNKK
jgi:hypothetical protein